MSRTPGRAVPAHGPDGRRTLVRGLLACAALGVAARVVLIGVSFGSNDMAMWTLHADRIQEFGLWAVYQHVRLFNHPPLMGWMAAALRSLAEQTGTPFRIWFKLPSLGADLLVLVLLWRVWRPRGAQRAAAAVALFACHPVSILMTAFHGNTDSLGAAMGLLAAFCHDRGRFARAGLATAAAVNVKLIGVVWLPVLGLLCPDVRAARRFAGGLVLGCLPLLLPLLFVPVAFAGNMLGYGSYPEPWGVNALLGRIWPLLGGAEGATDAYAPVGRWGLASGLLVAALVARRAGLDAFRASALAAAVFLLLIPGFSIQYLVWIVPVLAASSLATSACYGVFAGVCAASTYLFFCVDTSPLRSFHDRPLPAPAWIAGLLAWGVLALVVAHDVRAIRRDRA